MVQTTTTTTKNDYQSVSVRPDAYILKIKEIFYYVLLCQRDKSSHTPIDRYIARERGDIHVASAYDIDCMRIIAIRIIWVCNVPEWVVTKRHVVLCLSAIYAVSQIPNSFAFFYFFLFWSPLHTHKIWITIVSHRSSFVI